MSSLCGAQCEGCQFGLNSNCKGCSETNGCPFGKQCFVAKYILTGGKEKLNEFKTQLIEEINSLGISGMPQITELNPLNGVFVNLEYNLPNGEKIKFLDDSEIYLGSQVESEFNDGELIKCFGIVANMDFILVSEYGPNGSNPELIVYKKR
ncbi:MAG: DUF3795 domain-containing protein [Clostridia bacterium]|nr:DUF3795 domain-containing protein [Clostridia bacterium]